jgi:hypothetical protein
MAHEKHTQRLVALFAGLAGAMPSLTPRHMASLAALLFPHDRVLTLPAFLQLTRPPTAEAECHLSVLLLTASRCQPTITAPRLMRFLAHSLSSPRRPQAPTPPDSWELLHQLARVIHSVHAALLQARRELLQPGHLIMLYKALEDGDQAVSCRGFHKALAKHDRTLSPAQTQTFLALFIADDCCESFAFHELKEMFDRTEKWNPDQRISQMVVSKPKDKLEELTAPTASTWHESRPDIMSLFARL